MSGGTIAFHPGILRYLTNIHAELTPVRSWLVIAIFSFAFNHINGFFLISLFAGVFTSIATFIKTDFLFMVRTSSFLVVLLWLGLILVSGFPYS
ncbi:DUF368 domain-containing protein [Vibrio lentus]|nr:DUF368 domain-containing protein [Vibrio lentus]